VNRFPRSLRGPAIIGAAVALLLAWATADASAAGRIPKGFAYAAEVRVTIDYDGTFTRDRTFDGQCSDGQGNTFDQQNSDHESEHIKRTAVYRQITVPIVSPASLGAAAGRLALRPTVTDPGKVTSDASSYELSGVQLVQLANQCPYTKQPYSCQGAITNIGNIDGELLSKAHGYDPEAFVLPVFSRQVADPANCDALGDDQIPVELGIDAEAADRTWAAVELNSSVDQKFRILQSEDNVVWKVPVTGHGACESDGQSTCTQSVSGSARITMKRLALYRTRRSYAK